ncbi:MAG TPA: penicillin-binding transpeptidase domain-containing protein [Pyrinomonadaceae bacterium]|nr:penicillin-binding transpeptidase domain-containing protein [Pyrinomonadaceae bacterium]
MLTSLAFLFQFDWHSLEPKNWFGGQILERTPAGLSIIYIIGVGILVGFLFISFVDNFGRPRFLFELRLPREVTRKLTKTIANRSIRAWQTVFVLLALVVFGFQVYWVYFADTTNEEFQALSYKDLRTRRVGGAAMKPWILDRTGKLSAALASYKIDDKGKIVRNYPLDEEMAHLLGTAFGPPGLERTLFASQTIEMPEAWQVLMQYRKPEPQNNDVRITIDRNLQAYVASQLQGKKGAIVVVNPQNGDVLAMYSNPSYKLSQVQYSTDYTALDGDQMDRPLLSRATREYYMPGSTFKTVTMMSAFRGGQQGFIGFDLPAPDCYTPYSGSKPICDSGGSCEICNTNVGIRDAFKVSSNQYFAELANYLGRDRMGETARLVGIATVEKPEEATLQGLFPDIWNTSNKRIANAIAPSRATMVTGKVLNLYDFGIEGMGQGLASQMTPFQMALVAAVPGNLQGRLMKPKIEADQPPQVFSQVLSPQQGAEIRDIMSTVTEESGGTGGAVKAALAGTGIVAGGKTGTAQKSDVPIYDPKTGQKKFVLKKKQDVHGNIVEYKEYLKYERIDGWFICIAPLENPQVAIAVVMEDIGSKFGGGTAAPIAANVILKARTLGLLGDKYTPKAPPAQIPKKRTR